MASGVVAIYIGAGDYLAGVPARDMTIEEWETLSPEDQATALKLDLYQVAAVVETPAPVAPPQSAVEEE